MSAKPLTDEELAVAREDLAKTTGIGLGLRRWLATIDARDTRIATLREETLAAAADYIERENYYASNELIARTVRGLDGDAGRPLQREIDRLKDRLAEVERERDGAVASLREGARLFEGDDVKLAWIADRLMAHNVACIPLRLDDIEEHTRWLEAKLAAAEARAERYEAVVEAVRVLGETWDVTDFTDFHLVPVLDALAALDASTPEPTRPSKLDTALSAWSRWYSAKLERVTERGGGGHEGYSGAEQDLFEALGCVAGAPEPPDPARGEGEEKA